MARLMNGTDFLVNTETVRIAPGEGECHLWEIGPFPQNAGPVAKRRSNRSNTREFARSHKYEKPPLSKRLRFDTELSDVGTNRILGGEAG